MLRNYLKIAFRKLLQNKGFGLLYIVCLGVGVSTAIMLFKYYQFESHYDAYNPQADNLYRINMNVKPEGAEVQQSSRTAPPVGQTLVDNFAGVKSFSRVVLFGEAILSADSSHVKEPNILVADREYFNQFPYVFLPGSSLEAIKIPMTAFISKALSQKLYGTASAIGKPIKINSRNFGKTIEFTVRGVYENVRKDSHLRPEILLSYATVVQFLGDGINQNWDWENLYTYVLLDKDAKPQQLASQFNQWANQKFENREIEKTYSFQNIQAIHNDLAYTSEFSQPVDGRTLLYLLLVAIFVLVITYVNVINLYASIASRRLKEVGVRKTAGARRYQLFIQFITESFIINLLGLALAVTIIQTAVPYFESYFEIQGSLNIYSVIDYGVELIFVLVLGTLAAGFYPAIIMSGWKPQAALKGTYHGTVGGLKLGKLFLLMQFMAAFFLLAGSITIYKQMDHIINYKLGVDLQHKLVITEPPTEEENGNQIPQRIQKAFENLNFVNEVAATDAVPGVEIYWRTNEYSREQGKRSDINYNHLNVNDNYFDVFGIEFLAGKNFDPDNAEEAEQEVVLNSAAMAALGFNSVEEAIDKTIYFEDSPQSIVGVVKDFYQEGLKKNITPTIYHTSTYSMTYYILDYKNANPKEIITLAREEWLKLFPNAPFEYFFLDEKYNKQYQNDIRFQKFFNVFCGIALMISCIGLVGLSYQSISQQTKEIGIRKVLGASVNQMIAKLSTDYFTIAFVAYIIAIPLAFFLMNQWLSNFITKITLGLWFFVVPLLVLLVLVAFTIGRQVFKAATRNPVDSLRSD